MDTNPFGLPRTKIGLGGVRLIDMAGADAAVSYGGFTVANKDSADGAESVEQAIPVSPLPMPWCG